MMLHSLWSTVEQNHGKIIETKKHQIKAVEFPTKELAIEFCKFAHNDNLWYDALSPKVSLIRDGSWVGVKYPK